MPPRKPLSAAALDRLQARVEAGVFADLLRVLHRVRNGAPLAQLERALLERNVDAAVEALGLEPVVSALYDVQTASEVVRNEAWFSGLPPAPTLRGKPLAELSLVGYLGERPLVRLAVAQAGARRITAIVDETRAAIRQEIVRGLETGVHPRTLARQIRPLIGLNRSQVARIQRLRDRLTAEGTPPATILRQVDRQAAKGLRDRAENIARTETMDALNRGKRLQWDRLVEDQEIAPADWVQEWVTAADERTCPVCQPLHGVRVDVGARFATSLGEVAGPPVHPRCRCIVRLTLRGLGEGEEPNRFRPTGRARPVPPPDPEPPRVAPPVLQGLEASGADETPEQAARRVAFEERQRPAAKESALIQFADGTQEEFAGTKDRVKFSNEVWQRMRGAELLTHNHPGEGAPFSSADLKVALDGRIRWLRAVGVEPSGRRNTWETNLGSVSEAMPFTGDEVAGILDRHQARLLPKYKQLARERRAAIPAEDVAAHKRVLAELSNQLQEETMAALPEALRAIAKARGKSVPDFILRKVVAP